ncbi:hypothetical protein SAMN04487981_107144 [Streptomyces sp. cf386]|uniref:hypothetical protein n=1 Tax=Streptomyces sp. cf386 TaxID=1761904 RepID=UPI000886EF0D|nr:hypothetical protein [Streptomyces sp. cf386]SDN87772.1 hypothetical protein SAMN04487981_107144 [Streptomyces sp. cf386]
MQPIGMPGESTPAGWADAVDAGPAPDLSGALGASAGVPVTGTGSGIGGPEFAGAAYAPLGAAQDGGGVVGAPAMESLQDAGAAPEAPKGGES